MGIWRVTSAAAAASRYNNDLNTLSEAASDTQRT
jgi:hypothetical protein